MAENSRQPRTYRFADLTLDTGQHRLMRDGKVVDLSKKTYEFLAALVRAAPNLLSHEDILQQVWRGRVVGPETVNQRVKLLRDALGDDARCPRYVEVLRGQGYRLVPAVEPSHAERGPRGKTGRWLLATSAAFLAAVTVSLVYLDPFGPGDEQPGEAMPPSASERSIAVLPFENLSSDPDDASFVSGIHNDLLAGLAKISSLRVISRTSVLEYQDRPRNLREIGQELGASAILEGTVQRAGGTVRMNVQLIDARTDDHMWAETYDRGLTAENIFAIQSEMATSIAAALHATLTPVEMDRLREIPTLDERAYDFYLTGMHYAGRPNETVNMPLAVNAFERAVEEDPQFARAWAGLSRAHAELYRFGGDPTETRRRSAETAVEQAVALEPDAPEVRLALATYYYMVLFDNKAAVRENEIARRGMPGSVDVFNQLAGLYRRMGRWDEAVSYRTRAIELDPRNTDQLLSQAATYARLHDYATAARLLDRALELAPDDAFLAQIRAQLALWSGGDVAPLKAILGPKSIDFGSLGEELGWLVSIYERDYAGALRQLDGWDVDEFAGAPRALYYGETHRLAGQPESARRYFETARIHLQEALVATPENYWLPVHLGQALAGLGEAEQAVELGRRALKLTPVTMDVLLAEDVRRSTIFRIYLPAGAYALAVRELDALLSAPGLFSIEGLLPDPRLDPIRDEPRFVALLEKTRAGAENPAAVLESPASEPHPCRGRC